MSPRPISGGSVREAELPAVGDVARGATPSPSESPLVVGMRRLRKSTTALIGVVIVAALLVVALFADVLAPQNPIASDQTRMFQSPSWDYPLGTDQLGRDMLSRVIHGTRISLLVGVSSVLLALFVGVPFGLIAGYYGGRIDTGIMRTMAMAPVTLMVPIRPAVGVKMTIRMIASK